jgi:hypothetical protein
MPNPSARLAGLAAALLWVMLAVRWFDPAAGWRPAWLTAVPPLALALPAVVAAGLWLRARWTTLAGPALGADRYGLWLVVGLSLLFRLPLAWQGAVGYTTPDGALSGIVAIHAREGIAHHVFVPNVPYSGSLKSHLTAALSLLIDTPRAFTLCSVVFYALFVAGLYRLALLAERPGRRFALAAGLYAAFAPAFVTRYSLSNDGNYVEVLALGAWALWLAVRWTQDADERRWLELPLGLLLGLAFWCHILAVLYVAAVGLALLSADTRASLRALPALVLGGALGYLPGLLWNAVNNWESFYYVVPGAAAVGRIEQGPSAAGRALAMVCEQWPILMGYDRGYGALVDSLLWALAWLGVAAGILSFVAAARAARENRALRALAIFGVVNLLVATLWLPYVPDNPRYVLFLTTPLAVFLARSFGSGLGLPVLAALLCLGAVGSLAQLPPAARADERWRGFVTELERAGVRHCYSDFFQATRISYLSEERIVCSSELGPTTVEYFTEYRARLAAAPEAALIPVNVTGADRIERRLRRLGVSFERRDLVKPVFLRLSRKVSPEELAAAGLVTPASAPDDTPRAPGASGASPSP